MQVPSLHLRFPHPAPLRPCAFLCCHSETTADSRALWGSIRRNTFHHLHQNTQGLRHTLTFWRPPQAHHHNFRTAVSGWKSTLCTNMDLIKWGNVAIPNSSSMDPHVQGQLYQKSGRWLNVLYVRHTTDIASWLSVESLGSCWKNTRLTYGRQSSGLWEQYIWLHSIIWCSVEFSSVNAWD